MNLAPFSITGMKFKHFDDGLGILVCYTRLDSTIIHINSVHFTYNSRTVEQMYDCSYDHFQNFVGRTLINGKGFDGFTRVKEMMGDIERELRSVNSEGILAESVDAINYDGTINLQAIGIGTYKDEHSTSAHLRIVDSIGTELMDELLHSTNLSIKLPAPKRQRTRWELLELD